MSNKENTPATLAQTDELIASTNEHTAALEQPKRSLAERIVALETLLASTNGDRSKPIEQADGTVKTFKEVQAENRRLMDEWALMNESSRRQIAEIAARNPVSYATADGQLAYRPYGYTERPLMTEDDAVKEFGLAKWAALTPKQKAQAKTVKERVDRVKLDEIFGRTSSGRKAMALSSENPSLYRMCKRKAREEGLI